MAAPNERPRRVSMAYVLGFSKTPFKDPDPPPPPPQLRRPTGVGELLSTPGGFVEWAASDGRKGRLNGPGKSRSHGGKSGKASSDKGDKAAKDDAKKRSGEDAAEDENPHNFTPEQDKQVLEWKAANDGKPWAGCTEVDGKSADQCKERFKQIKPKDASQGATKETSGSGGGQQQQQGQQKLTKKEKKAQKQNQDQNKGQHQNNKKDQGSGGDTNNAGGGDNMWSGAFNPYGDADDDIKKDGDDKKSDEKQTETDVANQWGTSNDNTGNTSSGNTWDNNTSWNNDDKGSGSKTGGSSNTGGNTWETPAGNDSFDPMATTWAGAEDNKSKKGGSKKGGSSNKGDTTGWGSGGWNDTTNNTSGNKTNWDNIGGNSKSTKGGRSNKGDDNAWNDDTWNTGAGTGGDDNNKTDATWGAPAGGTGAIGADPGWDGVGGEVDTTTPAAWDIGGGATTNGSGGWKGPAAGTSKSASKAGDLWGAPIATDGANDTNNNNAAWDTNPTPAGKPRSKAASTHSTKAKYRAPLELELKPDETFSADDLRLVARILQEDYRMVWNRVSWRFRDKTGRTVGAELFEKKITGRVEGKERKK